jgi:hypothetical protein
MAERNAQFLQIGFGQIRQDLEIDSVLGKDGCILGEADPIKPSHHLVINAHGRALSPKLSFFFPSSPSEVNSGLKRLRPEQPRGCCVAEKHDEVAAGPHSITSSARASSVGGTSIPRALAILWLITSSYFTLIDSTQQTTSLLDHRVVKPRISRNAISAKSCSRSRSGPSRVRGRVSSKHKVPMQLPSSSFNG